MGNQTAAIRNNRPSFPDKSVKEGLFLLVYKLPVNSGLNIDFIIMTSIVAVLVAVMTTVMGVVVLWDWQGTTINLATSQEYRQEFALPQT